MRLVHQAGSVKVGEVVRYTLTYTPSHDRIVPTPSALHVKLKNTSAVALRAAYLHGPYTLYVACYPSTFDPNTKHDQSELYGYPQFEPNLKAGGSWTAQLKIPDTIRETSISSEGQSKAPGGSATWVIEVASQVLFSTGAAVHFEVLVGRDERSIDLGFAGLGRGQDYVPGQLLDHQQGKHAKRRSRAANGVYSEAVSVIIDDTASIWNTPELPEAKTELKERERLRSNPVLAHQEHVVPKKDDSENWPRKAHEDHTKPEEKKRKRQRIHLVLLTHGLHSNLGADMLYLKESIDVADRQARMDRQMRKAKRRAAGKSTVDQQPASDGARGSQDSNKPIATDSQDEAAKGRRNEEDSEDEDEQVIVRGYPGNAIKTERGIQYLGKRLAKYVLAMTYPDQPYLPTKKQSMSRSISRAFTGDKIQPTPGESSHSHSTIRKEDVPETELAYKITSISFVGHSLGGLIQTYAVAYIQKHSPEFFQLIKPINFVALASPFLGLSNENPLYVKFALDFGLVGRTGQDLGLTWRAPTMVRSGWGAMIAGMGNETQRKQRQLNPGSKPLLRILPAGPAHEALSKFRNRTVYSNVVNDGIVPLRTSCLLFLDWRGLGRVEKARRENGLVGTMAGWGWAELMGMNSSDRKNSRAKSESEASADNSGDEGTNTPTKQGQGDSVPQPSNEAAEDDDTTEPTSLSAGNFANAGKPPEDIENDTKKADGNNASEPMSNPFAGFLSLLKPGSSSRSQQALPKHSRIYKRSQTTMADSDDDTPSSAKGYDKSSSRPGVVRGGSVLLDDQVLAPPQTTVFEAAGDILNPPLPDDTYINDPASRPRTIFHDRIYHPEDIPPPPIKPRRILRRTSSHDGRSSTKSSISIDSGSSSVSIDQGMMKVEEKIARAYHRDLSWRKVLVRLEPDAHNNIIVRRMFANAYGWPVVKHLVDMHFADTYAATTADTKESNEEQAKPMSEGAGEHGEEVKAQHKRSASADDRRGSEGRDELTLLPKPSDVSRHSSVRKPRIFRQDSAQWDERFFASDDEDEDDDLFSSPRSPKPHLGLEVPKHGKEVYSGHDGSDHSRADPSKPLILPVENLTQSPSSAKTSNVGLQRTLEEQIGRASSEQIGEASTDAP